jgi:o-succinylbenzoate---CoA ligase
VSEAFSIFEAAIEAGGAPALRDGDRVYTFAELAGQVRARLCALERDARSGMPYPVIGANSLETVVTLYSLLERRIPALLLHPRLTDPEREVLLAAAAGSGPAAPSGAAAILYTSGTTGEPRGAVLTYSALAASAQANAANLGWRGDDCWLLCMPIARVGGLSILTRCLAARRCVALSSRFDVHALPTRLAAQRISLMSLVPTMLSRLLDVHPGWTGHEGLRAILLGGAAASPRLLQRAAERGLPIIVTYGLTETCSQVTATPYAARFETAAHGAGPPLPGVDVRVVDGHINVRGPMLMAGYCKETALAPDAWFDTGDLGAIDDRGCLHVHARRSDLIVTGGENVYPAEVERVLEGCPGVAAAAVFGVPDEVWGQTVAAALVPDGDRPSEAALLDYIGARLAPHKRPRDLCYVSSLPHTAAGKLDRVALAELVDTLQRLGRKGDGGSRCP